MVRPGAAAEATAAWAERVRAAVAAESRHRRAPITVSAGVAEGPLDELTRLLNRADRALYRASSAGRDRVERATTDDAGMTLPRSSAGRPQHTVTVSGRVPAPSSDRP